MIARLRESWLAHLRPFEAGGQMIAVRPVAWTTRVANLTIEHLAGPRSDRHLLVYAWSRFIGHWIAQDVTAATGCSVEAATVAWRRLGRTTGRGP